MTIIDLANATKTVNPSTLPVPDQKIAFLMITALCSGMTIITCGFVVITQGPSFKVTFDRERQRFLAFVSLLAAIFGLFGNGVQLSDHPKSAGQSIASFFFNWLVQLGFAGIAHNSIIRLLTARARTPSPERIAFASKICCIFYFLTLPVMSPTFISLIHPSRSSVKVVARDMNITFVCVVEALATVADVTLLWRFTMYKEHGHETRGKMIQDMWIVYAFIWFTIAADIFAKVWRNRTNDLISDLAITNLTLTLRALAALMYGSTLRNAQEIYSMHSLTFGHSLSKNFPLGSNSSPRKSSTVTVNPSQSYVGGGGVNPNERNHHHHIRMNDMNNMNNITVTKETQSSSDHDVYFHTGAKALDGSV